MLNYYKTKANGRMRMDPDFIFFLCWLKTQIKDKDNNLFELLYFIVEHSDENAITLFSTEQKALFEEKITKTYITHETCDICRSSFNWKDLIFKKYREKDGKKVPFHPYCLSRENRYDGSYRSDF